MTIGVVLAVLSTIIGLSAKPAGADVQSDQAEITALGSRIAQDGAQVQQLVNGYNQAQTHQAVVAAELVVARTHLDADRQAEARAQGSLRRLALNSYMSGDPDNATLTMFDTSASISVETEQEYTQVASAGLNNAIDAVMLDVQRTQAAASQLHAAQSHLRRVWCSSRPPARRHRPRSTTTTRCSPRYRATCSRCWLQPHNSVLPHSRLRKRQWRPRRSALLRKSPRRPPPLTGRVRRQGLRIPSV